jgi:RES domain-containing protein
MSASSSGGIPARSYRGQCWRILAPKWAFQPLSGAGSAVYGGRWNSKGVSALYMSEDFDTAFAEYEQDLLVRPGTFCLYRVALEQIADLCDPIVQKAAGVTEELLFCPWKEILLVQKSKPPTWNLAQKLINLGFIGVRVPSARRKEGVNLVLWRWGEAGCEIEAFDPKGELPRDQHSWQG